MNPILFYVMWVSITLGMLQVIHDEIYEPARAKR
jgi:hypothetical protein